MIKRYSNKIQNFLTEHGNQLETERKTKHENMIDDMIAFANKTNVNKTRSIREQAIQEIDSKNQYYTNIFNDSMSAILTNIVAESLQLDSEYAEQNPGYKIDIQDTIDSVFQSGNVNQLLSDQRMLNICNTITDNTPLYQPKTVITENIINTIVEAVEKENKEDINSLINDVSQRVLDILADEKKQAEEINKDLEKAIEESAKFIKEKNEKTLFESLCFNNAKYQIQESGNYDSQLAVANGILTLTVLESLKETGFLTSNVHEKNIIKAILG